MSGLADKRAVEFDRQVEGWVLEAVERGATCFDELLLALPSVYPSLALRILCRLAAAGKVQEWIATDARTSVALPPKSVGESCNGTLPVPHPLDFEWRFTGDAAKNLVDRALKLLKPGHTLALLGVTSVFREVASQPKLARRVLLVDCNRPVLESLTGRATEATVIHGDVVHGQLPAANAQVVISDGPWYLHYLKAFLRAARQVSSLGSHILVSIPPVGTRPGMDEEWKELQLDATRLQLRLEELEPLELPYVSPPFERNALRAEGITNYPYRWRRGNLAVFSVVGQGPLPPAPIHPPGDPWHEEIMGGVRIRVRSRGEVRFADPALHSVVPGDVLPSVSARDERRNQADVWTSGNRVYSCSGPRVLRGIIASLRRQVAPQAEIAAWLGRQLSAEEEERVALAERQVRDLVNTEQDEIRLYAS